MHSHVDLRKSKGLLRYAVVLVLGTAPFASVWAQQRLVVDPPLLDMKKGTAPRTTLMALPVNTPRMSAEKQLDLNITFTKSTIYNPASGRYDEVNLRSYVGTAVDPKAPHVAPTIEVYPGDTVRIDLHNQLPADPSCTAHSGGTEEEIVEAVNTPHCFNGTNLHAHGLWVSPSGNSDNVLLSINPGVSFQYEYNIPPDHPAGTFWYHTHRHGSTALQVASGMAGALIVRGDRMPSPEGHGDIDTLLKNVDGKAFTERLLVLQQIQYACRDSQGVLKTREVDGKVVEWVCDPGDIGGVDGYEDSAGHSLFGMRSWGQSGRYTSINGQVLPTFNAKAGDIERWRLIHAGVHDTISLKFLKLKPHAPSIDRLTVAQSASFISDNCVGEPLPYHLIASDGLTMEHAQKTTLTTLQPGYRNDALVVFPEPGAYCVINDSVTASASVTEATVGRRLMGLVGVQGGTPVKGSIDDYLKTQLIAVARHNMPVEMKTKVMHDLSDGLKLSSFTPHPDIEDGELKGPGQQLTFFINIDNPDKTKFEISGTPYKPQQYDPKRIDRKLILGTAEEWTLQSRFAGHPFHIHVNPFQVVKILDPNGKDVSAPDAVDDAAPGAPDTQYAGLKGVWKDTLWVKSLVPDVPYPHGAYTVVIRTRYERYIGDFVLHCHILDHEDQGMMQNVSVMLPDGQGGMAQGH